MKKASIKGRHPHVPTERLMRDPSDEAARKLASRLRNGRTRASTLEALVDMVSCRKSPAGWLTLATALTDVLQSSHHPATLANTAVVLGLLEPQHQAPVLPALLRACDAKRSFPTSHGIIRFYITAAEILAEDLNFTVARQACLDALTNSDVDMRTFAALRSALTPNHTGYPDLIAALDEAAAARAARRQTTLAAKDRPTRRRSAPRL